MGAVLLCLAGAARALSAQAPAPEHLNFDKLQVVSLGVSAGTILPSQLERTTVMGIAADYGEILPSWRVVASASFWKSHYRGEVVQAFVDTLNRSIAPGGGARVQPSPISLYDVTFGGDLRYAPVYSGELKPFAGLGVALHVINAEGTLINGTFVERALDDVALGLYATTGVSFRLVPRVGVEASARADLLSGFRSVQARVGGVYFFGRLRGATPGADGSSQQNRP